FFHRRVLYLLGPVVLALMGVLLWRQQPTYGGKTVREWVWQCARTNRHEFRELPTEAIKQMGQSAIPLLAAELRRESTSPDTWIRIWRAAPKWAQQRASQRIRRRIIALHDEPAPYEIRETAARTFGALGPQGRAALPELRAALGDSVAHVRLRAAYAMWQ